MKSARIEHGNPGKIKEFVAASLQHDLCSALCASI